MDKVKPTTSLPPDFQARINANPSICILCGKQSAFVGIFVNTSEEFARLIHQPENKQRLVIYKLCEKCFSLPDKEKKVEDELLKTFMPPLISGITKR